MINRILILIIIIPILSLANNDKIPDKIIDIHLSIFKKANKNYLAVSYKNYPNWHTYWDNPGEAGLPIENKFFINNKKIKLLPLPKPAPSKFIEGDKIQTFGYKNEYTFFYHLPNKYLKNSKLTIKSNLLVCKHVCIPRKKEINAKVKDGILITPIKQIFTVSRKELTKRFSKLPIELNSIPNDIELSLWKDSKNFLALYYKISNVNDKKNFKANLINPFRHNLFGFLREKLSYADNTLYGKLTIEWNGEYSEPKVEFPKDSNFVKPQTIKLLYDDPKSPKTKIFTKTFNNFNNSINIKYEQILNSPVNTSAPSKSILFYLLLAFIGGLILNIMPCVLPVISLKLFELINYSQTSKMKIIRHNIFYILGTLSTFLTLAIIVLIIKKSGNIIGWGFQFQSPHFVMSMTIVLFIMTLNLFGLFEFSTIGGKFLGNIKIKDNIVGEFLSGIFATILSTPCSAPFLGTALAFAFSAQMHILISVFLMIGLGLSFPFVITAIFPQSIKLIPRPGKWMNHIKKLLAIAVLITMIWMLNIYFSIINNTDNLVLIVIALTLLLSGFFIKKYFSKRIYIYSIPFIISIAIFTNIFNQNTAIKTNNHNNAWEPWSKKALLKHKELQNIVFIDFTAKWCLTCKANEKLVLHTNKFYQFAKENNIKLMKADITKKNIPAEAWLNKQNIVGIPAYFLQKKDGSIEFLGEVISINKIKNKLN